MNISKISSSNANISRNNKNTINANIKSQQESDNINKKNVYKYISKISNNADIRSHQRSDDKVCIMTLDGRKVITSTIVHIISAESHNMSDNTTGITTYHIASEFGIDTMIVNMQESCTKSSYINLKNIIEENAQDISDHTLHIKKCWKSTTSSPLTTSTSSSKSTTTKIGSSKPTASSKSTTSKIVTTTSALLPKSTSTKMGSSR